MEISFIEFDNLYGANQVQIDNLSTINIITGSNGAGKSNLMDIIKHFIDHFTLNISHYTPPPNSNPATGNYVTKFSVTFHLSTQEQKVFCDTLSAQLNQNRMLVEVIPTDKKEFEFITFVYKRNSVPVISLDCISFGLDHKVLWSGDTAFCVSKEVFTATVRHHTKNLPPAPNDVPAAAWNAILQATIKIFTNIKTFRLHTVRSENLPELQSEKNQLIHDGTNVHVRLLELSTKARTLFDRIEREFLSFYGFNDFRFNPDDKQYRAFLSNGDENIAVQQCGSGARQMLTLLVMLLAEPHINMFFIEEPETNLHAHAIRKLMNILDECKTGRQIFIVTHSPVVIDCFEGATRVLTSKENHVCKYRTVDSSMQLYRELGHRPSEFFMADMILWVEGLDDVEAFKHFIQLCEDIKGFHIAVMYLGGDNCSSDKFKIGNLKKLHPELFCVLDSERFAEEAEPRKDRIKFATKCDAESVPYYFTKRTALENYLTKKSIVETITQVKSDSFDSVPEYGILTDKIHGFSKDYTIQCSQKMTWKDIETTDLKTGLFDKLIEMKGRILGSQ